MTGRIIIFSDKLTYALYCIACDKNDTTVMVLPVLSMTNVSWMHISDNTSHIHIDNKICAYRTHVLPDVYSDTVICVNICQTSQKYGTISLLVIASPMLLRF
jgi:hypothetical protein